MELRQIRYFVAVAEELHFRRAAQKLHVAQPPLSQQIQRLERELGTELFRRTRRKVELTGAGESFLAEARRTLVHAERAEEAARSAARGESGWLRIGFVGSISYDLLPRLLGEFREHYPQVQMALRQLTTEAQIEALQTGDIDVGLAREMESVEGLTVFPLFTEPLIAALPDNHLLAEREHISLEELSKERFITVPRSLAPRLYDRFVYLCHAAGFSPTISQEASQFPTILGLVSAELGVSAIPDAVRAFPKTGVSYRALTDDGAESSVSVAHRADENSAVIEAFLGVTDDVITVSDEIE